MSLLPVKYSPIEIANGAYIDYTIRFQNTGTDTAFNVVLSDTLAGELLLNTLQVTASSHTCKATVKDNIVFFEFLNILLPDSNVNEIKSHGFVSFRIKPHPSVPSGTTINNKAAIYFDYNTPVITNTAGTFIKTFTIIPIKLISLAVFQYKVVVLSVCGPALIEISFIGMMVIVFINVPAVLVITGAL